MMGRDERFKAMAARRQQSQQDLARMAAQARAVGSAGLTITDRLGVEMHVQDLVLYRPPFDLLFKIEGMRPVNHPQAPPGSQTLLVSCVTEVHVQAGQLLMPFVVVGVAENAPAEGAAAPGAQEPVPAAAPAEPSPIHLTDAG